MFSLYTLLALPLVAAVVGSALVSLAVCLHDLLRRRHSLPSLHYRESTLNNRLLARCGLRQRVFSPSCWLTSAHVQTILAACWPRGGDSSGHEVSFQREYLQMRDKGVVALDWVLSVQPRVKRKSTVLLVLPPVTGDAHTASALCGLATKRGFRTVVFNRRGHGGSVLTTARLLNAADPSDLRQVVKYLRLRFPKSRLAAVAFGTGCGLLISYLGEFGSSALLSAGACVSPCYDTVEKFSGSLRSIYDLVHLLKLKWILLRHAKALSTVLDVKHALLKAWSFRTYEEAVYCKMYNYVSRSDSASHAAHSPASAAVNVNGVANSSTSAVTVSSSSSSHPQNGGPLCSSISKPDASHSAVSPNGKVAASSNGKVVVTLLDNVTAASSQTVTSSSSLLSSQLLVSRAVSSSSQSLSPSALSKSQTTTTTSEMTSSSQPSSQSASQTPSQSTFSLATQSKSTSTSSKVSSHSACKLTSSSASQSVSASSVSQTQPQPPSHSPTNYSPSHPATSASPSPPVPQQQPPPSPAGSSSNNNINSSGGAVSAALEEYWERNNPIRDVDDIAVPVLCINSLDDPFFSGTASIPYDLFRCYPNFLLVVTERGGHCGFLERYPFRSWADSLCLDYLEAVFELTTRGYANAAASSSMSSASASSTSRRNTRSTI